MHFVIQQWLFASPAADAAYYHVSDILYLPIYVRFEAGLLGADRLAVL